MSGKSPRSFPLTTCVDRSRSSPIHGTTNKHDEDGHTKWKDGEVEKESDVLHFTAFAKEIKSAQWIHIHINTDAQNRYGGVRTWPSEDAPDQSKKTYGFHVFDIRV